LPAEAPRRSRRSALRDASTIACHSSAAFSGARPFAPKVEVQLLNEIPDGKKYFDQIQKPKQG
jgi:hypothetical protein